MKKLSFLLLLFPLTLLSQRYTANSSKEADKFFENENYTSAIPLYMDLLKEDSGNVNYLFRLGISYLRSNIDKSNSIPFFEELLAKKEEDELINLLLAHAYQFDYQFDKAIEQYNYYMSQNFISKDKRQAVLRKIESCENAKELIKYPLNVTFENLGDAVNSPFPDYFPFVTYNEDFLVFNSRRPIENQQLKNGFYPSEVYISNVINGKYEASQKIKGILNTDEGNEDVIGLTGTGKYALFYLDNDTTSGNIYMAKIVDGTIDSLVTLDASVNSYFIEAAASFSADGKTIYFSSDRPEGFGGFDLYAVRQLPDGHWGLAENLGPEINTEYDEDFPNVSSDGKSLYFSSKGHTSMGGFDIFVSTRDDDGSWKSTRNIGYPINTPDDDMNFRISETGKYGYISSLREEGYGDVDIYRVVFHDIDYRYTVLTGHFYYSDSTKTGSEVMISVFDNETSDIVGDYQPNPTSGRYVIILPPGNYNLSVSNDIDILLDEEIQIFGKSSFVPELNRDFYLPIDAGSGD